MPGRGPFTGIAAAPDWSEAPVLVVARLGLLARTRDGGQTWEDLGSSRISGLSLLRFAPGGSPPALFAWSGPTLYRSLDAGTTWLDVLTSAAAGVTAPDTPASDLRFSPEFAQDGVALFATQGRLHRSRDGGAAWEALDPAPGQRITQVAFSPTFSQDHTLFAVAGRGALPSAHPLPGSTTSATGEDAGLGLLVSDDGGDTWTPTTTGLAIDGLPYPYVQQFAVSPTYADDHTLFVFARGIPQPAPGSGGGRAYSWSSALFRSTDGGASWAPVLQPPSAPATDAPGSTNVVSITRMLLALSPTFARDGLALLGQDSVNALSIHAGGCAVWRTTDHGTTWRPVRPPASDQGCAQLAFVGVGPGLTAILRQEPYGWAISRDGGATWPSLAFPGVPGAVSGPQGDSRPLIVPSPAFARDRTLFIGVMQGLWVWRLGCPRAEREGEPTVC